MKFLRREEVGVNLIKGDPDQPRKFFDPTVIHSMAATMVSNLKKGQVGIINDIEVDDKYIIITGEQRYRAAKLAGLKTVPCKVYSNIDKEERYYRQGLENMSRGSMAAMEMSDWVVKVLTSLGAKIISEPGSHMERNQGYVTILSKKIGKTPRWIYQMLDLQKEKPTVKEYLRRPDAKWSIIREINDKAPEELQDRLKEKVVKGSLKDRETTNELIRALTGYDEGVVPNGKIKQQLLDTNYSANRSSKNIRKIDDIYPEPRTEKTDIEKDTELGEELSSNVMKMVLLLGKIDLGKISASRKPLIINSCKELIDRLQLVIDVLSGKILIGEEGEQNE